MTRTSRPAGLRPGQSTILQRHGSRASHRSSGRAILVHSATAHNQQMTEVTGLCLAWRSQQTGLRDNRCESRKRAGHGVRQAGPALLYPT